MHLFFKPQFFFDDEGGGGSGFDADMAILSEGDSPEADSGDTEVEDEEAPEPVRAASDIPAEIGSEEGEEDEEADEEESEEPKEEEAPVSGRPSIKAIKKEFPDVFKKFPVLKTSLFRDAEFSKSFASPEEAAEAATKASNYDQLESSLVSGSPELLMRELSTNNPKAFQQVVTNWLPELRKTDERAYLAATEPVIEELIYLAYRHAEKVQDKNLAMSARHLANFVFANGGEIPDLGARQPRGPSEAELQLQREREQWANTRFKEADQEIFGRVTKALEGTIRHGLDPDNTMPERIKSSIVTDVINELNQILVKDPAHARRMNGLWRRAHQDSYSRQSKESIINTYLSGAKPLLREIRNRVRSEYVGNRRAGNGAEKPVKTQQKRPFEGSSKRVDARRERATVLDPKKIDYARTSDADILNDRVTLKGR